MGLTSSNGLLNQTLGRELENASDQREVLGKIEDDVETIVTTCRITVSLFNDFLPSVPVLTPDQIFEQNSEETNLSNSRFRR
jgi:hypothetical protein